MRCESSGASRQVWIGTQSLAHPTEWIPLADCAWTDDGLITPTATEILRDRPSPTAPAADRHHAGTLPENVTRFIRGLEAAQRTGTVEHVRRLCDGSGPFLETLAPAVRADAEQALAEARSWLAGHEDYQQRVFADLAQAVSEKRAWDVRSQLQTATALTRRGASPAEQRILTAARAFLRQQDHLSDPGAARTVLHPLLAPRPKRRRKPKAAPRPQQAPTEKKEKGKGKKESNSARTERRERSAAVRQARTILNRLQRGDRLPADEQRKLTDELATAVQTAGDWLSAGERQQARSWIKKTSQAKKQAQARDRQGRRELPPDVLESAAAAVRGALKKTAREQTTTTWSRLRQQLGSALPHMTLADRVEVLTLVDRTTPADQALLSSLVAAGDPDMMTSYRKVAGELGLDVPADDNDLRDILEADVHQVHHHWRRQ
ncbi:hypothetical protein [Streptomyces cavernae]|uniref:hypothetical protein n=1 Tax=Streptomyces cavernae TaxID=2259034 RepID=UPI001391F099|nr:hypothetical protein [Streptomyces cavernae]